MNKNKPYIINLKFILLVTLLSSSLSLSAQLYHFGLPISDFYPYQIENLQAISSHQNNILFSADEKLVEFNGYYSTISQLEKNLSSLHYGDSTLFYGSDNAYGTVDLNGLDYTLNGYFTDVDDDVTHIVSSNYGNFILTDNTTYHFQESVAKKYSFPGIVDYLGNVNSSVILHDDTNGLSIFIGGRFKIVNNSRFLSRMEVVTIKSLGSGEYLVATRNNGLFRSDGDTFYPFGEEYLKDERIVDIEVINSSVGRDEIVIITENNQLLSLTFSGSLLAEKMYTSPLLGLHKNEGNALYVFSKKGIEVFFYNLPMETLDLSPDPIHGPVCLYDQKLYWGTNNGLFYSKVLEGNTLSEGRVRVKDTEGKVGNLDVVYETLLMSHEDGLYDVLPRIGARFIPDERFYGFTELKNNYLLAFSDRNSYLLKLVRKRWRVAKVLDDLPIHPKSIVFVNGEDLWLVDRDYGLLHYVFDFDNESVELLSSESNSDKTQVFELDSAVIMVNRDGVFRYNSDNEAFEISDDLTAIFGKNLTINDLIKDQYDNIWYIQDGQVGIFRAQASNGKKQYKKLAINYPDERARSIYPFDKNNIFINNGDYYVKLNLEEYVKPNEDKPYIYKISKANKNQEIALYNSNARLNSIEGFTIRPQDGIVIYMGGELTPGAVYEYSMSSKDEPENWQVSPSASVLQLENIPSGRYSIRIRKRSYNGISEALSFRLDVNRGLWEGKNKFYILAILGFLLVGISFMLGITVGERKAYRDNN